MGLEQNVGVVIYQGEQKPVVISLRDQDGDAFNLTNASEIAVLFKNADGTALIKKMSAAQIIPLNAGGGKFQVNVLASETLLMLVGDNQPLEIRVTINGVLTICQAQSAYSVLPSLFPGA